MEQLCTNKWGQTDTYLTNHQQWIHALFTWWSMGTYRHMYTYWQRQTYNKIKQMAHDFTYAHTDTCLEKHSRKAELNSRNVHMVSHWHIMTHGFQRQTCNKSSSCVSKNGHTGTHEHIQTNFLQTINLWVEKASNTIIKVVVTWRHMGTYWHMAFQRQIIYIQK